MINKLNVGVSLTIFAEEALGKIQNRLGLSSLELHTSAFDNPTYPAMWVYQMGEDTDNFEGITLQQFSLKGKEYDDWTLQCIQQMFLEEFGFAYSLQTFRAYLPFYNHVENRPDERLGTFRVEPVFGQLWKQVKESDPSLYHYRLRLETYYD